MNIKLKKYAIVQVIWRDIVQISAKWEDGETFSEKTQDVDGTSINSSVGHYISRSKKYIHIAQSLSKDRKTFGEVIIIPFGCIEKINEFKSKS